MKIRSFTRKAIALALLSGAAVGANATVHNLGAASVGAPLTFNAVVDKGPFTDIFTFTLPANNGSGYTLQAFDVNTLFVTELSTLSLVSNKDNVIGSSDDHTIYSSTSSDLKNLSFSYGSLPAGSYYLYITGLAKGDIPGTLGGLYNGAISVTAVPEPESYALFLAGLGIMGAIARRRSKANGV